MLKEHSRIVVIGTSGSGKTTFARKLAWILQREHIELDALHWGPHWTPRPEFPELVRDLIAEDTWLVDGNYSRVRDQIWERATAVVWLNYSFQVVFFRAIARTVRRIVTQEDLYARNKEAFRGAFLHRDGIPWWVIRTYSRRRREFAVLLRQPRFQHLAVFELSSPSEALALLESEAI